MLPSNVNINEDNSPQSEALEKMLTDMKSTFSGLLGSISNSTRETSQAIVEMTATRVNETPDAETVEESSDAERENDELMLEYLDLIADYTKVTSEQSKVMADAIKEQAENVLKKPAQTPIPTKTGTPGTGGAETLDPDSPGGILAKILGVITGILGGLVVAFAKVFEFVMIKNFLKPIGNVFKNLGLKFKGLFTKQFPRITKAVSDMAKSVSGFAKDLGSKIGAVFTRIKGFVLKPFNAIGNFFKNINKGGGTLANIMKRINTFLQPVIKIFKTIGSVLKTAGGIAVAVGTQVGKIFPPIFAMLTAFSAIRGALEGFMEGEGILGKLIGAITGAMEGIFDFLVSMPINLIKDLFAWIGGMLGFDKFQETLDGFEFSFDWLMGALGSFFSGLGTYIRNGIAGIGIPGFEKTFFEGTFAEKTLSFGGFYPFSGLAVKEEVTPVDTSVKTLDSQPAPEGSDISEVGTQAQVDAVKEAGMGEAKFVRVPNVFGMPALGESLMVSATPDPETGAYAVITDNGGMAMIEDESGALATLLSNIGANANLETSDPGTGENIEGATTGALDATSDASGSGGGNIVVGGSTTVGGSTSATTSTTNVINADNSLKSRSDRFAY